MLWQTFLAVGLIACATSGLPAEAASLKVSPVNIERVAAATATLTLTNTGKKPINVQIRVFRWVQHDGEDLLQPTRDVVASPPMNTLDAGVDYTVRLVRLSKAPVVGEESYRILVDELPDRGVSDSATVTLLVRYSIPIFFRSEFVAPAEVAWRVRYAGGHFVLSAQNTGESRFKVGRTVVEDARGHSFEVSAGLVGYVLAGSSMTWTLPVENGEKPKTGEGALHISSDGVATYVPVVIKAGG